MLIYILLSSFTVMIASLAGVIFLWKGAGDFIEKNLKFLVSLSAGVFIVVAFRMISETLEHASSVGQGVAWILTGVLGAYAIFKGLPSFHHHHDMHEEEHPHSRLDVRRIIAADGIHNIADGIFIASSFALSPALGAMTTASVFIHELVQEISEFFMMRQAGYSIKNALLINFAVSSTILIGSLGAFFSLEYFRILEVPLLAICAGIFLVVVLFDLIPHSVRHSGGRIHYITHLICFITGAGLMASALFLLPHEHGHKEIGHVKKKGSLLKQAESDTHFFVR